MPSLTVIFLSITSLVSAQRVPVLNQIDLPHPYYFRELYLPQFTTGPSSLTWSPDSKHLIYSMMGSLWLQTIGSEAAKQLTDGDGYDYQPDWSSDGKSVVFVRYNGSSCELISLNLDDGNTMALTNNGAVNLEPQWSPDGSKIVFVSTHNTKHFLLHVADFKEMHLSDIRCLTPDRKNEGKRYYYSPFDHAINPSWSPDGKRIYFVSNREIVHGTGDIVSIDLSNNEINTIHHEETNWQAKPDVSPDGTRLVYSSYAGRNFHQLWMMPSQGGYPMPLTYGEYENRSPRWSPDGERIAFISNRTGNTSLWIVNVFDGGQSQVEQTKLQFHNTDSKSLKVNVKDEYGKSLKVRLSVVDSKGKFYAPLNAVVHADDSRYPNQSKFEAHYFHSDGSEEIIVPNDKLTILISHGSEYELIKKEVDANTLPTIVDIVMKKQNLPADFTGWRSGDLHVHMNYGGNYLNTPSRLIHQAEAENVNYVFNLIVNKEQRFPDVNYFSPKPEQSSSNTTMILHSQEFHTSFWGHLGLLNLNDHLILPGYSGYAKTAVGSLFPHNSYVADRAHEQKALVGYVHPFEQSEIFPEQSPTLFNELPIDVALGKVDYYELMGFSDHKASEFVWYHLLNAGFKIPAGAGTDAMANYASLHGPVGLNRVYAKQSGDLDENDFLNKMVAGKSFVTNGPVIGLTIDGKTSGDSIFVNKKGKTLSYSAFLRSQVPIDLFEIIYNGDVIASHTLTGTKQSADVTGSIKVKTSGWLLLRAWNDLGHPDLFDLYAYASTNPVYIVSDLSNPKQRSSAEYFLKWIDRIEKKMDELPFRTPKEKQAVLDDVQRAKNYYQQHSK